MYWGRVIIYIIIYRKMNQYDQQAQDFLTQTGTTLEKEFMKYAFYFPDDKEKRNIWSITMNNKNHSYTFTYWDSVINSSKYTVIDMQNKSVKHLHQKIVDAADKRNNQFMTKIWNIKHDEDFLTRMKNIWYCNTYFTPKNDSFIEVEPSDYSILACLDILYERDFNDFCDSYWYDNDSMHAKKIYDTWVEQDRNLRILFDRKELEQLAEIQ